MKLLVTHGSVEHKGKSYLKGESFDAPKDIADFLLDADVVTVVEIEETEVVETTKKASDAKSKTKRKT